jgi:hypothetical protein
MIHNGRMRSNFACLVIITTVVSIAVTLGTGCAGEVIVRDARAPTTDSSAAKDSSVATDGAVTTDGVQCNDGDKRCEGLDFVMICSNGQWETLLDCRDKDHNGQACHCSMTLMFVCAYGAEVCG